MVLVVDHTLVRVSSRHGAECSSSTKPPQTSTTGCAVQQDRHRGPHVGAGVEAGRQGVDHRPELWVPRSFDVSHPTSSRSRPWPPIIPRGRPLGSLGRMTGPRSDPAAPGARLGAVPVASAPRPPEPDSAPGRDGDPPDRPGTAPDHHRVVIVGAGFGGVGLAVRLQDEGVDDVVVLEREDDLGGTWYVNTYPGCQCDVPSLLYSLVVGAQPRVDPHLRPPAGDRGVPARGGQPHQREAAHPVRHRGHRGPLGGGEPTGGGVETPGGTVTGDLLVLASGFLSTPSAPAIDGPRPVRRHGVPLGPLGPRPRPGRRAGGGDRDRRLGRPVRAPDPARGRTT